MAGLQREIATARAGTMVDLKVGEKARANAERRGSRWVYFALTILVVAFILVLMLI